MGRKPKLKIRITRFFQKERVQDTIIFIGFITTLYFFIKAAS
jgi:hypothetical protein